MDFRVLGPLEVPGRGAGSTSARRQRAVLAVLLVHLNEVVSIDRLIDELWGETPPNAATASLQAYVSNLRRVLEPDRSPRMPATVLVTEAPGYVLRVPPVQLDAARFEDLATPGRRALEEGDAAGALTTLDRALGMWRGDAFAEFAYATVRRIGDLAPARAAGLGRGGPRRGQADHRRRVGSARRAGPARHDLSAARAAACPADARAVPRRPSGGSVARVRRRPPAARRRARGRAGTRAAAPPPPGADAGSGARRRHRAATRPSLPERADVGPPGAAERADRVRRPRRRARRSRPRSRRDAGRPHPHRR